MGETDNSEICAVCRDVVAAERTTRPCTHTFCRACFAGVVAHATSERVDVRCPLCRHVDVTCVAKDAFSAVHHLLEFVWRDIPEFFFIMLVYAPYVLVGQAIREARACCAETNEAI
jgi:hypothetical protein